LLLAIGLAVAGYSYALTLQRGQRPTAEPDPAAQTRQVPTPTRLAPDPGLRRQPVPASVGVEPTAAVPLTIVVENLPSALDPGTAGVALFATETGAEFRWLPLAAARDGKVFETTSNVVGSLTATVAAAPEQARHGYLAAAERTFARANRAGETLTLDASAQQVQFGLANPEHRAGPLQIRRVGDARWHARATAPTGLLCRGKEVVVLLLGAGDYELVDPIDQQVSQRFTVPSHSPVMIREGLSRPAAGHL
jgi:hypothetical protein